MAHVAVRSLAVRLALTFIVVLTVAPVALAQSTVAVFGDNSLVGLINGIPGHSATLVNDAQVATPGFLSSFDAFVYTRDGSSFGTSLSAAASAEVVSFVGGAGAWVLFVNDGADAIGDSDPNVIALFENAVQFATASGNGFVGEFNGAVAGLTSNGDGMVPLAFTPGSAGPLGSGVGGSDGNMNLAPAGVGHPVTAGVSFPFDGVNVEWGAVVSGVDPGLVLATFDGGNPAIIAGQGQELETIPVLAPAGIAVLIALLAIAGIVAIRRYLA